MMIVSMFGTKQFFEVDYKFGQNDLVEFAKYAIVRPTIPIIVKGLKPRATPLGFFR